VAGREPGLEREHPLGRTFGVGDPGQLEHPRHVRDVRRALLGERVLAVVRLVGQADAALQHVHDVLVGLLGVDVHAVPEDAADALQLQRAERRDQVRAVLDPGGQGELVRDRVGAEPLDGLLVEEAAVQVGDLARLAALGVPGGQGLLDQPADALLGVVGQRVKGAVDRLVGGDLVRVQPRAVRVQVQVVLRPDGSGQPRNVDP
jgi:hypothetical protein